LIQSVGLLGEIGLDIDRNRDRNAGLGFDDGKRLVRDHVLVECAVGAGTPDPYVAGGNPVFQLDDEKEFQHLPVDHVISADDFLAPSRIRQQQRLADPGPIV